jgi:hypothetical protein
VLRISTLILKAEIVTSCGIMMVQTSGGVEIVSVSFPRTALSNKFQVCLMFEVLPSANIWLCSPISLKMKI